RRQIDLTRIDHQPRTESDAVEGGAIAAFDFGERHPVELPLGDGAEFIGVHQLIDGRDSAWRFSGELLRARPLCSGNEGPVSGERAAPGQLRHGKSVLTSERSMEASVERPV